MKVTYFFWDKWFEETVQHSEQAKCEITIHTGDNFFHLMS